MPVAKGFLAIKLSTDFVGGGNKLRSDRPDYADFNSPKPLPHNGPRREVGIIRLSA